MKKTTFKAEVLPGHKEAAVEVPFNPIDVWAIEAKPLWHGRRGHAVKGRLNGCAFESVIVPRQKKFYMLIGQELERETKVSAGDVVEIAVEPRLV
ncbi:MAG: DUF1905 domain-containing protein [Acidobacteriota bacterium]|nr:DUF1905 domain-containing protein [Acidobacteriota bacterium]